MLTLLVSAMGSFVSCKDYDEDVYVELRGKITNQTTLIDALDIQVKELKATVDTMKSCNCQLKDWLTKTEADATYATKAALADSIAKIKTANQLLENRINSVETTLNAKLDLYKNDILTQITLLNTEILNVKATITNVQELLDGKITALDVRVTVLEGLINGWDEKLTKATEDAAKALEDAKTTQTIITTLQSEIESIKNRLDNVENQNCPWTPGKDGYWYKNGEKTDIPCVGEKGADGAEWTIGPDGYWYKDGVKPRIRL